MNQLVHEPVLAKEVLQVLGPKEGDTYLDTTAGYGGHAKQVISRIGKDGLAILVDRDQNAIQSLSKSFSDNPIVQILHEDFYASSKELQKKGQKFDMILADLGVSSPHLNSARRGFSFMKEGPLDMRMDQRQPLTAADIANSYSQPQLTEILRKYGEVRNAPKMAKVIAINRPYKTTTDLANVIARATPGHSKIHPATKVFQAFRIAVNQELSLLEAALPVWVDLLADGGRLAVISFHILEDRRVKQFFTDRAGGLYDSELKILTKKPITGRKT